MHYSSLQKQLQALFLPLLPLSPAQCRRLASLSSGLLLAGEVHLTKIARWLTGHTQQDSRVRWIQRLLEAPFLTPERVYQPVLKHALGRFRDRCWHIVIDRTTLWDAQVDLATISLQFRKRAIPLVWRRVPFGGAPEAVYIDLLKECMALVPAQVGVIFHGDSEFGSVGMIRALREHGWDFIVGQRSNTHFRPLGSGQSLPLSSLPVTPNHPCQVANVELFAQHRLGGIQLVAFYQPHHSQPGTCKRQICYLATSLPLTAAVRRLGQRRWGTEAFYRDYKSSGWHIAHHPFPVEVRCPSGGFADDVGAGVSMDRVPGAVVV